MTNVRFRSSSIDRPVETLFWKEIIATAVSWNRVSWAMKTKIPSGLWSMFMICIVADGVVSEPLIYTHLEALERLDEVLLRIVQRQSCVHRISIKSGVTQMRLIPNPLDNTWGISLFPLWDTPCWLALLQRVFPALKFCEFTSAHQKSELKTSSSQHDLTQWTVTNCKDKNTYVLVTGYSVTLNFRSPGWGYSG